MGATRSGQVGDGAGAAKEKSNAGTADRERRWQNELEFFERLGAELSRDVAPTPETVRQRYLHGPRRWYQKEYRFRLLGRLDGKRVLDVGCGDGSNAVLLAFAGAEVVGLDLSPQLIQVAQRRAELDGVQQRTQFLCGPLEEANLPDGRFDIVWGDGILHHVIPELEQVLFRLGRWAKAGALAVFSEPVALSKTVRALRRHIPIHTDATPDERPLEKPELELIRRFIPDLRLRQFHMLGRLAGPVLQGTYEDVSAWRRGLCDGLHLADYALLALPPLRPLGAMSVMMGHFRSR